jgi:hypothetical protein
VYFWKWHNTILNKASNPHASYVGDALKERNWGLLALCSPFEQGGQYIYIYILIYVGVRASLRAPRLIPRPLNTLQTQWTYKAPRGWQACTWELEPRNSRRRQAPPTARPRPSVQYIFVYVDDLARLIVIKTTKLFEIYEPD